MKKRFKVKYNWDLFGKEYGLNIIDRLDYINGKPMVWVGMINLVLLVLRYVSKQDGMSTPEIVALTSSLGWSVFNTVMRVAFWILFVDGIIVNFLCCFTRGAYFCPFVVLLIK